MTRGEDRVRVQGSRGGGEGELIGQRGRRVTGPRSCHSVPRPALLVSAPCQPVAPGRSVWAWRVGVTVPRRRKAAGREADAFVGSPGPGRSPSSAPSAGPGHGALSPLLSPANLCRGCNFYRTQPVKAFFPAFLLLSFPAPVQRFGFVGHLGQRGGGAVWKARGVRAGGEGCWGLGVQARSAPGGSRASPPPPPPSGSAPNSPLPQEAAGPLPNSPPPTSPQ